MNESPLTVVPLTSDEDWCEYNRLLLECFPGRCFKSFFARPVRLRLIGYGAYSAGRLISAGAREGRQLHWICTLASARRRGLAKAVCERLLEGVSDARVKINPSDAAAEALYRSLGFRLVTYGTR